MGLIGSTCTAPPRQQLEDVRVVMEHRPFLHVPVELGARQHVQALVEVTLHLVVAAQLEFESTV